jgi:phage shock protein B
LLIFGFIPLLAFAFVLLMVFGARGRTKVTRKQEEEEMRWMQQMNDGLTRLADRVDALETLMLDRPERARSTEGSTREP